MNLALIALIGTFQLIPIQSINPNPGPRVPTVDYDWDDPSSYGYGWRPFVQQTKGYVFGNITCEPDTYTAGVMGDYGNCHDPAIGEINPTWKSCVHVFLDEHQNTTDWRCACHFSMHPRGTDCTWDWGGGYFINNGLWFMVVAAIFITDGILGYRLTIQMLQLKGWKMNAAITSNIFVTLGMLCEGFRHTLYCFRNMPGE